jgi:hypothetical protein
MRSADLKSMTMQIIIFCDVTSCSLIDRYYNFYSEHGGSRFLQNVIVPLLSRSLMFIICHTNGAVQNWRYTSFITIFYCILLLPPFN